MLSTKQWNLSFKGYNVNAYAELFATDHLASTLTFPLEKLGCCVQHKDKSQRDDWKY